MQLESLGYRTDLMLLRLQGGVIEAAGDYVVVRTPENPAFHWGNFVLGSQSWVDRPLADLVEVFQTEHPEAGHLVIGVDGVDGRVWSDAEVGECGLGIERSVVMTAMQVQEPLHPNTDAVCRMLASDADWATAVDLQSAESGEFDPAEHRDFVQPIMAARRRQQEAGLGGWFGAFVGGEMLCDLGLFTDGSGLGRFQSVETLASARRIGLASTLVHYASLVGLRDFGIRDLVMVADPDDTAIRIYRSLGFADSEIQVQLARPVHGPEV
jgi:ribosomal protein S18 acetylase RimI-like enzyme